jgi:heme-degrading monooxygenase HmoA
MYARVWKLSVLPDKVEQFATACRAVGALNRKHAGFRGLVVLRGGRRDAPSSTVVSVWDSLEALRNSETESFHGAVARALACCKPGAELQEDDVLVCDFTPAGAPSRKAAAGARSAAANPVGTKSGKTRRPKIQRAKPRRMKK